MIPSLAATVLLVLLYGGAPGVRLQSVAAAKPRYTNSWAVEVSGGSLAADELANKHGFVNLGQVSALAAVAGYSSSAMWRESCIGGVSPPSSPARLLFTEWSTVRLAFYPVYRLET